MISDYLIVDKKILPENVLLVVEANRLISEKKISISDIFFFYRKITIDYRIIEIIH